MIRMTESMFCALFPWIRFNFRPDSGIGVQGGNCVSKNIPSAKVAEAVIKENITHMLGVPTHYRQLLRYEPFINIWASLKRLFARQRPLAVKWHGSGTKNRNIFG